MFIYCSIWRRCQLRLRHTWAYTAPSTSHEPLRPKVVVEILEGVRASSTTKPAYLSRLDRIAAHFPNMHTAALWKAVQEEFLTHQS